MEFKSRIVTSVSFDIILDEKNTISFDSLRSLLYQDYYDYFPDIYEYHSSGSVYYISDITPNGYDAHTLKKFGTLFNFLENKNAIRFMSSHNDKYVITDLDLLQILIEEVKDITAHIINNEKILSRDALLENSIES